MHSWQEKGEKNRDSLNVFLTCPCPLYSSFSDPFPVRESMIVDGIGTCIASFFGSPFGTVVYIGHPAHKRSGAKVGYSLANGVVYL